MIAGIVKNKSKKESGYYAEKLKKAFKDRGADVLCDDREDGGEKLYKSADIIISIGGDGTFLRTAARAIEREIPVFGFNLGTLGFLTEFDKNHIDTTVNKIASGDYDIEERRVLSVSVASEERKTFFGYGA